VCSQLTPSCKSSSPRWARWTRSSKIINPEFLLHTQSLVLFRQRSLKMRNWTRQGPRNKCTFITFKPTNRNTNNTSNIAAQQQLKRHQHCRGGQPRRHKASSSNTTQQGRHLGLRLVTRTWHQSKMPCICKRQFVRTWAPRSSLRLRRNTLKHWQSASPTSPFCKTNLNRGRSSTSRSTQTSRQPILNLGRLSLS